MKDNISITKDKSGYSFHYHSSEKHEDLAACKEYLMNNLKEAAAYLAESNCKHNIMEHPARHIPIGYMVSVHG